MDAYKGDIIYTVAPDSFTVLQNSFILVKDGIIHDICQVLDSDHKNITLHDYSGHLIIPSFIDMHLHSGQYMQKGLGMDKPLLQWLESYTFKEEARFSEQEYAQAVYESFCEELIENGSLKSVIFATVHKQSTEILFEKLIEKGLSAYVGKVNMDMNCPMEIQEGTITSLKDTEEIVLKYCSQPMVKPIITPRFVPTCSRMLLQELGKMAFKYNVPVQSHLSENREEVQWVKELFPDCQNYSRVYNSFGLFGQTPTIMAHCIYLTKDGKELIKNNGVGIVHCPQSNFNLSSGIMPAAEYLNNGINVFLGSDIAAGHSMYIPDIIVSAVQASKIIHMKNPQYMPLTLAQVFYMASTGPENLFPGSGKLQKGMSFDALIIDDERKEGTVEERLQRFIYTGGKEHIKERFLRGISLKKSRV